MRKTCGIMGNCTVYRALDLITLPAEPRKSDELWSFYPHWERKLHSQYSNQIQSCKNVLQNISHISKVMHIFDQSTAFTSTLINKMNSILILLLSQATWALLGNVVSLSGDYLVYLSNQKICIYMSTLQSLANRIQAFYKIGFFMLV